MRLVGELLISPRKPSLQHRVLFWSPSRVAPSLMVGSEEMDIVQLSCSIRHRDNKGSGVSDDGLGIVLCCSCVLKFGQSFSMSPRIPRCQKSFGCMNMSFHHRSADEMRTVLGVMRPRPPSVGGLISVLIFYCWRLVVIKLWHIFFQNVGGFLVYVRAYCIVNECGHHQLIPNTNLADI